MRPAMDDEKQQLQLRDQQQQQPQQQPLPRAPMSPIRGVCPASRRNRPRPLLPLALLALLLYCYYHLQSLSIPRLATAPGGPGIDDVVLVVGPAVGQQASPVVQRPVSARVPLEAHIMSKCPDAKDCLRDLILPTMQKAHDKVDFTLSFLGRPTDNDGVACKHGPEECLGNIIELCAQELYPDPKAFLGFTMCMTKDYMHIPQRSLVEDCALEHAIDFDELNKCATKDDGAFGIGMLRSSVRRSSEAGVTQSCTVRLNKEIYCVRDDGEWKDCPSGAGVNDLLVAIEKLYHS